MGRSDSSAHDSGAQETLPAKQPDLSTYALSLSSVYLTVGVLGITAALCLGVIPRAFKAKPIDVYSATFLGVVGMLLLARALTQLPGQVETDVTTQSIRIEYDTATVGLEDLERKIQLKGLDIKR